MMQATLPNPATEKEYWVDEFKVRDDDLEYLFNLFLETEAPLSLRDITLELIKYRLQQEDTRLKKQLKNGEIFQPKNTYQVGQSLIFPSLSFKTGQVQAVRAGNNVEYGEFEVIDVAFEDGSIQEFAASLKIDHALNIDLDDVMAAVETEIDPEEIIRNYGRAIARKIKARFDQDADVVYLAGRWFLKSLLVEINIAHLHLAEAVLDINSGGPLATEDIFKEIGMAQDVNHHLQIFSLDYAMQQDKRFDEVGPAGEVLWYLSRMEPEEVHKIPFQLQYDPIDYDPSLLNDEMQNLLLEIDDELSPIEYMEDDEDEVTLTLTYPYRRTGTLPLSGRLQYLFPTAYETTRIRMTMIDAETHEEVPGWVVREHGYVFGLMDFYKKYMLPVGGYITLRRHEDSGKLWVDFARRPRPRTEWIKLAVPQDNRLVFQNHKRAVGADYDELMNFGVEDIAGVDALWPRYQKLPMHEILRRLLPELAMMNPQQAVHLTTIYSAVNMVRRCPPDPIFATLVAHPDFENVGGPYWRMATDR